MSALKFGFQKTSGYTVEGTDEVEFMISMNPGEPTRPLATVASGGELPHHACDQGSHGG